MMSLDEVNEYIHTQIMGLCWHDVQMGPGNVWSCLRCGFTPARPPGATEYVGNPDYCSDESPRSLLNEAQHKVITMVGFSKWSDLLLLTVFGDIPFKNIKEADFAANSPVGAERISRTLVAAHAEHQLNKQAVEAAG